MAGDTELSTVRMEIDRLLQAQVVTDFHWEVGDVVRYDQLCRRERLLLASFAA